MAWPKGRPRPENSGRKRGTPNRSTAALRAVVAQALDDAGGPAYLAGVARDRPELFLPLVRKVLPRDAAPDALEAAAQVAEAARLLGGAQPAAQDAPGAPNEGGPSPRSPLSVVSLASALAALRRSTPEPDIGGDAA